MKLAILAGVSALAFAGAASAQDGDWTGFYIGASAGYGWQGDEDGETILFDKNLDGSFDDTVTTAAGANAFSPGFCGGTALANNAAAGCEDDDEGAFAAGLHAGYDWQMGPWVLGGVAEWSRVDVTDSVTGFSTTPASYVMTRELDSVAAIRGRAGYVYDRYLGYVTAGFAWAQMDHSFDTTNTANAFTQDSDDSVTGYQVGLGVETMVTPTISLGAEYLYTSLDDTDAHTVRAGNSGTTPATNPFLLTNTAGTDFRRSDDFNFGMLRVKASYRF